MPGTGHLAACSINDTGSMPDCYNDGETVIGPNGKKWKVVKCIGEGRCCTVYEVHAAGQPNIRNALKVYKMRANYRLACQQEHRILNHIPRCPLTIKPDNIVRVDCMFEHRGHLCLITELLQRNVSDITHRNLFTELRLYTVQVLLRDLLLGVQAIHEAGYVHADLKPANMMWSAEDSNLKLFDFSLSFRQGQQINYQVQTRCYRSPEAHAHNVAVATRQALGHASWVSSASAGPPCSAVKRVKPDLPSTDSETNDAAPTGTESKRPRRAAAATQTPREHRESHQPPDFHISSSIGPGNLGHARDQLAMLTDLKDLVASLLQCRPQRRPSARCALTHPFFKHRVLPSAAEMLSLPSPILRLVNIVDEDQLEADDEYQDALVDIQEECEKFGPIKICFLPRDGTAKGKAFVHYTFARHCQKALESLTGRAFNQHTILATYFPLHSWTTHQLF